MKLKQMHLCFVGNMLGRNSQYITTQGQIVADLFAAEGFAVTCVSSKINRAARLEEIVRTLIKNRRRFGVVLLEVYSGMNFVVANTVAALCGNFNLPLIMVLHGGNLPSFIEEHPKWTAFALNRAAALVAPSVFLAKQLEKWNFEVQIIPNVIDLNLYKFRERSRIAPKLIWMRSFHPIYNPRMAVNALQQLHRKGIQNATLTMAGRDKGMEADVRKMAETMNLSGSIRFAGFLDVEEKRREFAAADVYINTNRIDNMPVSVLEARAFGLPVVATAVGGLPHLIEHGEDGLLVADGDSEAMAQNIESLLADADLTRRISRNGRKLAENSAWSKVRGQWEKLILHVVKNKSMRPHREFLAGGELSAGKLESKL